MARDRIDDALGRLEAAILPELSALIRGLVDAAALARPGVDAEAKAAEIRALTAEVEKLGREVEAFSAAARSPRRSPSAA
jgi:type II secretory pathway component PulM